MSSEHLVFIVIGVLVVIGILAYSFFLIFLPEWVGVTGKVAREAERVHREGTEAEGEDIISKWHQPPSQPGASAPEDPSGK